MQAISRQALGGILLISGTAIGAGMLALPIGTAQLGLGYTFVLMAIAWYFMASSAFVLLETNLIVGKGLNLGTLAARTLGKPGIMVTTVGYLALLYALTVAYLTAGSAWIVNKAPLIGIQPTTEMATISFAGFILLVIWVGTWLADWVNRLLMLALVSAFILLLFVLGQHGEPANLATLPHNFTLSVLPLLILSCGFHIIIPTLTSYIPTNREMRLALGIGASIPLFIYVIWLLLIFSVLPYDGPQGLIAAGQATQPTNALMAALAAISHSPWLEEVFSTFTFLALTTSLVGVSVSLFDYLADQLLSKSASTHVRFWISGLTILPATLIVLTNPTMFLKALNFGGLCVAVVLGILPSLMLWRLKPTLTGYTRYLSKPWHLVLSLAFFSLVIIIESYNLITG